MDQSLKYTGILLLTQVVLCFQSRAQDLEPRAYNWIPVNATILTTGLSYSAGDVVTDPTIPVKDANASVGSLSLGLGHTFNFLGKTAQIFAAVPFSKAKASGTINGERRSQERTGCPDMRIRFSVLWKGAPATAVKDFAKRTKNRTILASSITIQPPTGQYFPDKLINLGTGRWAFKPEMALSQPVAKRWLIDFYTAVWLFTENTRYYTGQSKRKQNPVGTLQLHTSYNIRPNIWAAINTTYYLGGASTIDGLSKADRVSNFRIGVTGALPTGKRSALRIAFSTGAVVIAGTDFSTVSVGWTYSWF